MEMIHEAGQYVDTVKRVCEAVGSEVTFRGTVHRVRDMSDFSFVVMRVERGLIQCTFQGDEIGGIKRSDVKDAMVLEVTGTVREEPRAEHGVEVVLSALSILGKPYDQLPVPLGKKYMGLSLDVDLPLRPITLRHPRKQAIFRVQGAIADGFAQYMQSQGFTHIHTPRRSSLQALRAAQTCSSWITLALRLIWHSPRSSTSSTCRCIRPCIRDRLGLPCRASQYLPSSERVYGSGLRDGLH